MSDIQNNVLESNPEVQAEIRHREVVNYLRQRDCTMLSELKEYHEDNMKLREKLNEINNLIAEIKKKLRVPKPKFNRKLFIGGLIAIVIGIIILCMQQYVVGIAVAVVGAVFLTVALKKHGKAIKLWQEALENTKAEIYVQEKNAQIAQQNIDNHWENVVVAYINKKMIGRFPSEYAVDYNAVCFILYVLIGMRSDNIKEAINLYEDILFRNKAIATLTESVRYAARTAVASERSARANEATARHAAETAAAAAATAAASAASAATLARGVHVKHSGRVDHYFN